MGQRGNKPSIDKVQMVDLDKKITNFLVFPVNEDCKTSAWNETGDFPSSPVRLGWGGGCNSFSTGFRFPIIFKVWLHMDVPQLSQREKQLSTSSIGDALDGLSFPEALMDELVNVCRDDSPDAEVFTPRHVDRLELWIGGNQPDGAVSPTAELFDGELTVKFGDDDGAVPCIKTFVHDQDVARLDACAYH